VAFASAWKDSENNVELIFKVIWVAATTLAVLAFSLLTMIVVAVWRFAIVICPHLLPPIALVASITCTLHFAVVSIAVSMTGCAAYHLSPDTLPPLSCGVLAPLLSLPQAATTVMVHSVVAIIMSAQAEDPGVSSAYSAPLVVTTGAFTVALFQVWAAMRMVSGEEDGCCSSAELLSMHTILCVGQVGIMRLSRPSDPAALGDHASKATRLPLFVGAALFITFSMTGCAAYHLSPDTIPPLSCGVLAPLLSLPQAATTVMVHSVVAIILSAQAEDPGVSSAYSAPLVVTTGAFTVALFQVWAAMRMVSGEEDGCCSSAELLSMHTILCVGQVGIMRLSRPSDPAALGDHASKATRLPLFVGAALFITFSMTGCAAYHLSPDTIPPLSCGVLAPLLSLPQAATTVMVHSVVAIILSAQAEDPGVSSAYSAPLVVTTGAFTVALFQVWAAMRMVSGEEDGCCSSAELLSMHTILCVGQVGIMEHGPLFLFFLCSATVCCMIHLAIGHLQ
jgi:hypothetical protein